MATKAKIEATFPKNSQEFRDAEKYIKALYGLASMLETPAVNVLLAGVEKRPEATLGDLMDFMATYNLRFGAAETPRQKAVYRKLYPMLDKLRDEVVPVPGSNPRPDRPRTPPSPARSSRGSATTPPRPSPRPHPSRSERFERDHDPTTHPSRGRGGFRSFPFREPEEEIPFRLLSLLGVLQSQIIDPVRPNGVDHRLSGDHRHLQRRSRERIDRHAGHPGRAADFAEIGWHGGVGQLPASHRDQASRCSRVDQISRARQGDRRIVGVEQLEEGIR